ncbi:hypothetical protein FGL01_25980 [Flavobacterium glycines]|uniref:Uncharacterized protein n=1 Tax=Flavobacterium glycines TaxID=551990 RepID=A0A511CGY8_9FLAO|nr:hypothetical protein FGL01_25980 [Flavobacterium glycines]
MLNCAEAALKSTTFACWAKRKEEIKRKKYFIKSVLEPENQSYKALVNYWKYFVCLPLKLLIKLS